MKKTYTAPHTACIAVAPVLPLASSGGDPTVKPGETEEQYSKGNVYFDDEDTWTDDDEEQDY